MGLAEVLDRSMSRPGYRITPGMLSKLSGVSKATIVNWLRGRVNRPRSEENLWRVADALRLDEVESRQLFYAAKLEAPFNRRLGDAPFARVPVGLYRTTPDGRILYANAALVALLGYPTIEAYLCLNVSADLYADPRERVAWRELIDAQGVLRNVLVTARRADGTTITLRDSAAAVRNRAGAVTHYEGLWEEATSDVVDARPRIRRTVALVAFA